MEPAMTSNRSLFSVAVLRSAVSNARNEISSRAARAHQKQARICSQNARGKSKGRNTGCTGEPIRATIRKVSRAKKIDMQTNRAIRLRCGINFEVTASATIAQTKIREESTV